MNRFGHPILEDDGDAPGDLVDQNVQGLALDCQLPAVAGALEASVALQECLLQTGDRGVFDDLPVGDHRFQQLFADLNFPLCRLYLSLDRRSRRYPAEEFVQYQHRFGRRGASVHQVLQQVNRSGCGLSILELSPFALGLLQHIEALEQVDQEWTR